VREVKKIRTMFISMSGMEFDGVDEMNYDEISVKAWSFSRALSTEEIMFVYNLINGNIDNYMIKALLSKYVFASIKLNGEELYFCPNCRVHSVVSNGEMFGCAYCDFKISENKISLALSILSEMMRGDGQ